MVGAFVAVVIVVGRPGGERRGCEEGGGGYEMEGDGSASRITPTLPTAMERLAAKKWWVTSSPVVSVHAQQG